MPVTEANFVEDRSKQRAAATTTEMPTNRLCYCTYGPEVCGSANETCIKDPKAACFHSVELVHNTETKAMEKWHSYGCLPLELTMEGREASASHFQCNGWRSSHTQPKSIACCDEGNYCNKNITPPPFSNVPSTPEGGHSLESFISHMPLVLIVLVGVVGAALVLMLITCAIVSYIRYRKTGKWRFLPASRLPSKKRRSCPLIEHADNVYIFNNSNEKTKMLVDIGVEASSGSGSGVAHLVQRTVGGHLVRQEWIGKGRYGEVWKAEFHGSDVAVKVFYTTEEHSWKNEREVYQSTMLNHENILRFVAADIQGNQSITEMLLITDFHELGSLHDYLKRGEPLSSLEALQLAHSAVSGIAHLHDTLTGTGSGCKPEIAHRDIKSKNIIVKRAGVCAIADFGLAIRYYAKERRMDPANPNIQVGTKRYMAPEVLDKTLNVKDFNSFKHADIYSYALVLWELARRVDNGPLPANMSTNAPSLSNDSSIPTDPVAHSPSPTLSKRSDESSTGTARPYEPPFEGMVASDPSFEEMKQIVCEEQRRPPLEESWRSDEFKGTSLHLLADLMIECWSSKPSCRHSALKLKTTLKRMIESFPLSSITASDKWLSPAYQPPYRDVDSGIRSKTQS
uniref:receptor protein serine/threonine kinase n=1 Tax=Plectus sambesii TaxID=2011161 RepID=A0A914VD03_9BILA